MQQLKSILAHICHVLLGLTFIFSGLVKAIDPLGTTYKIEDYLKAFGGFFTDLLPWAGYAAFALITIEFVLGVCLFLNIRTRAMAWISFVFYLVMLPLTLYIALYNPVSDCGCFGDAVVLTNWQTFGKNVILMALTILLLWTRKSLHQLWVTTAEWVIALLSAAAVISLMVWTLHHLPLVDFRPYKVGNHLPTLMEYPEDAPQDEYEITFVYEKNGVEQEFTLENYPQGDSTWTFVRQNSTLLKKGYEPPIHDFEIINPDYEDITYDILESPRKVTLIVMYDVLKADAAQMRKVLALKHRADANSEMCYVLTGSGSDEVYAFLTQNDAQELESVVCSCDPVTLKTIVRANPGVVELRDGKVRSKYNIRNR